MNTFLFGINAKFIHSNLAIRYLQVYAKQKYSLSINICEFTINQRLEFILREIYLKKPDIIGFSCYIWNYEYVKSLCHEIKKVLPNVVIILGGPEVSFNPHDVLEKTCCDYVISGEGEEPFARLVFALENNMSTEDISGISFLKKQSVQINENTSCVSLDDIAFVYNDISDLENKIIYYESSRGCPFNCQYCLSSSTRGVKFLSLQRVYSDLDFFLKKSVRQVKFVDRTFNCDKKRAIEIWKYLIENDNGITNFHFEIAADLIDEDMILLVKLARRGLFQFEIGIQSTNTKTLKAIKRNNDMLKLSEIINKIRSGKNIHLHLDLIAGLPYEDYKSFSHSFDYVYSLKPDQLQLGFLKLLKGSGLYDMKEKYSIAYTDYAPYEVLSTDSLSFDEILQLKSIEEMVECFYNSNRFINTIDYLSQQFSSPFFMFEALSDFYIANSYNQMAHNKLDYYDMLFDFFIKLNRGDPDTFSLCCTYDIFSHEKVKVVPKWVDMTLNIKYREEIFAFFDNHQNILEFLPEYEGWDTKQIIRQSHIQVFKNNPITLQHETTAFLYNYKDCDILGNAQVVDISKYILLD